MIKGEINALDAFLNISQPLVLSTLNTEKNVTAETVVETTQIIVQDSKESKLAVYFTRIKKRLRNRSTNIL